MLALVEPDLKFSPKQMEKFLPFVRVGFTAPATRLHSEEVWLHCRVTPGKQFHADIRSGSQDFSFGRAHQPRIVARRFEQRKNVGAIEARDAAQRRDGRTHLDRKSVV